MRGQLAHSCRGARTIPFPRSPSTQGSTERLHGVRHDALGADRIDGMAEPNEEPPLYKRRGTAASSEDYARSLTL
jgi:hypothetical protein